MNEKLSRLKHIVKENPAETLVLTCTVVNIGLMVWLKRRPTYTFDPNRPFLNVPASAVKRMRETGDLLAMDFENGTFLVKWTTR
jgi:hypothetical protein